MVKLMVVMEMGLDKEFDVEVEWEEDVLMFIFVLNCFTLETT